MAEKNNFSQEINLSSVNHVPEITVKSVMLGIILSVVMGAANAYLGLKVGVTISACIPSAVISIALLRLFGRSNILENNIVQTTASAGEVIAAAVVFTLPALVMIGYWDHFPTILIALITASGGILGVFFSVPLRRALMIESKLQFPEGVATAEVLQAGTSNTKDSEAIQKLIRGGIFAALFKFFQTGLFWASESFHYWSFVGTTIFGCGTGFSLACLSSGYIVGIQSVISLFLGSLFSWLIGIPLYGLINGLPSTTLSAQELAFSIWASKIRIIGVGTMFIGGICLIGILITPLRKAMEASFSALRTARNTLILPRIEQDIPFTIVLTGIFCLTVPVFIIVYHVISPYELSSSIFFGTLITGVCFILSFVCASMAGYTCGVLGSSHNPLSGVTLLAILILSAIFFIFLDPILMFATNTQEASRVSGSVILLGCIISCAAAVSGDNLQDLKSGQIVGSTPWKQQLMLVIGVFVASFTVAPVLELLFQAYGIGSIIPRPGMDPTATLSAPKASLMATVSQSIFHQSMNWDLFLIGSILGVIVFIIDTILKKRSMWRIPVIGFAIGIYMPLDITMPIFLGGLVNYLANKTWSKRRHFQGTTFTPKAAETAKRNAMLLCAGSIAGESLLGVALSIPFVMYETTEVFRWIPDVLEPFTGITAFISMIFFVRWIYQTASIMKPVKAH